MAQRHGHIDQRPQVEPCRPNHLLPRETPDLQAQCFDTVRAGGNEVLRTLPRRRPRAALTLAQRKSGGLRTQRQGVRIVQGLPSLATRLRLLRDADPPAN